MDTSNIRSIIEGAYGDFQNHPVLGLPAVETRIRNGQQQADAAAGQMFDRSSQMLSNQNQQIMNTYGGARLGAGQRSQAAVADIQRSIANAFGAFGRTPQTIGEPGTDYSSLQPALTQAANRTVTAFSGQNNQLGRAITEAEGQQASMNADAISQLASWRKLQELSNYLHAAQALQATQQERLGAGLEKGRTLANITLAGAGV